MHIPSGLNKTFSYMSVLQNPLLQINILREQKMFLLVNFFFYY